MTEYEHAEGPRVTAAAQIKLPPYRPADRGVVPEVIKMGVS